MGSQCSPKFGQKEVSFDVALDALRRHAEEPQVVSAAIAAMYSMAPNLVPAALKATSLLPPEIIFLSAIQSYSYNKVDLPRIILSVDDCDALALRLALIAIGLDKAPENLLDKNHSNRALVKALARHDDDIVAQYSVWAVMESVNLGVEDLGVDLSLLSHSKENIRGYVYRLYGRAHSSTPGKHEILQEGAFDVDPECRLGLASSLKGGYYDGLEELVIDWLYREINQDVQDALLVHMASASVQFNPYTRYCREFFEKASSQSVRRSRILSGSVRTPLFRDLKSLEYDEDYSLFNKGELRMSTGPTFNIGSMQGVVAQGSTVTIKDQTNNMQSAEIGKNLAELLSSIRRELACVDADLQLKAQAGEAISKVESNPSDENVRTAAGVLSTIRDKLKGASDIAGSSVKLAEYTKQLLELLPG